MSAQKTVPTAKTPATKSVIRKKFSGVVKSAKDKTILVLVERVKMHPKYKKRYTVSRKYPVHDEASQYQVGDQVSFIECRPLSKTKRWRSLAKKA